jgi:lipopolysaccharide heptosyltransferase II
MRILTETQRIKIAKWIDEYAGRWLIRLINWFQLFRWRHPLSTIERILFIKFWGIGSIILAEPALRYLRKKYPQARIDFLTLEQNRELFALIPHVDRVYVLDFDHPWRFFVSAIRLIIRLRRRRYHLIFDAEFFANFSALVASLALPKLLMGFSRIGATRNRLLDVAVPFNQEQHAAENFLRLAASADAARLRIPALNKNALLPRVFIASPRTKRIGFPKSYVVINVNASSLALARRWPRERFVKLAQWLLKNYASNIVLIGSRAEREYTQDVARAIGARNRVMDLAGELSIVELANLIAEAALFISNDSGPLHLAAALQKPVVGFYGPETPQRFGPLCRDRLIFYLGLPCSPCMSVDNAKTVNCTNHLRCMTDLKAAMVIPQLRWFIHKHELLPSRERSGAVLEY